MIRVDVNVLVHAPRHAVLRPWLEEVVHSDSSFALSELVLSGFLRVVTHPRVFTPPTPLKQALEFVAALRAQPNCILVGPGERHWSIFTRLCRQAEARGNLIPDGYLAALAIESGSELVSTDRDFSRFTGLRWRPPLGDPPA